MSESTEFFTAPGADVSEDAVVGAGSKVWHLAQVREQARLGERCIVGRAAYIGTGVEMGDDCKVQNLALVYEPARLGRGVFIGPGVVLTNDTYPRAVNPDLSQKSGADWEAVGVEIGDGAAIGARSVCVAPVRIGAWALVAAGSVVTRDVPDFALVAGVHHRAAREGRTLVIVDPSDRFERVVAAMRLGKVLQRRRRATSAPVSTAPVPTAPVSTVTVGRPPAQA